MITICFHFKFCRIHIILSTQVEEFREVFHEFDIDGDGTISIQVHLEIPPYMFLGPPNNIVIISVREPIFFCFYLFQNELMASIWHVILEERRQRGHLLGGKEIRNSNLTWSWSSTGDKTEKEKFARWPLSRLRCCLGTRPSSSSSSSSASLPLGQGRPTAGKA